jgi:nucleotide sugar dehydrogenase
MFVGIAGLGFVGGAMYRSFTEKGQLCTVYDKFKDGGIGLVHELLKMDIIFLCLPTLYSQEKREYDKSAIHEICEYLENHHYNGIVVIKSTVEPETTDELSRKYDLHLVHNPEFLTARTAYEDFHNQEHIVLGRGNNCNMSDMGHLESLYSKLYPNAKISHCTSLESESMKIFCNSFYASKVMLFNEYYILCQKNGSDFNKITEMMLGNKWINEMHISVPGPDGELGYGGACFPKDTNALCKYMEKNSTENKVLRAVIEERNELRENKMNEIITEEKQVGLY